MIRRPPRSTQSRSSAASDVYKRQVPDLAGTVIVIPGDAPLLTADTLRTLVEQHQTAGNAATLLTASRPDATGYGRVLRDEAGAVLAVVEDRDATPQQRLVREVATSVYAFEADLLRAALGRS